MSPVAEEFCQACIAGDVSVVKEMLERDSSLANAFGMVRSDHQEFMRQSNAEGGWTAIHLAAHYGQVDVVQLLIQAGADLNALSRNAVANTPLMAAIAGGQVKIVSLLLESGADPLKTNASGDYNAMKLAEVDGKAEIASLLAKRIGA